MTNPATVMLVRGLAVAAIAEVAAAAFRLSFVALRDLAIAANTPVSDAWLFPVIIDVTTATAAVAALVLPDPKARRWFVGVLVLGTLVSIAGNAAHALMAGPSALGWGSAIVAALPPVALLVQTHALVLLFRLSAVPQTAPKSNAAVAIPPETVDPTTDELVSVPVENSAVPDPAPVVESTPVSMPVPAPPVAPVPPVMPAVRPAPLLVSVPIVAAR